MQFINQYKLGIDLLDKDYGGTLIELNGKTLKYKMVGLHLHINSEHSIEENKYQMEIHLVHQIDTNYSQNVDKNETDEIFFEENKNLVIGLFFKTQTGFVNHEINKLIKSLNTHQPVSDFNINHILNKQRAFYFYKGSLTTPTCDEVVNWIVYELPLNIGGDQLAEFVNVLKENNYPNGNSRDVKPLNNRDIWYYHGEFYRNMRRHN